MKPAQPGEKRECFAGTVIGAVIVLFLILGHVLFVLVVRVLFLILVGVRFILVMSVVFMRGLKRRGRDRRQIRKVGRGFRLKLRLASSTTEYRFAELDDR